MNIYSHHALINAVIYKWRNWHPECKLQFIPLISGRIGLEFRSLLSRTWVLSASSYCNYLSSELNKMRKWFIFMTSFHNLQNCFDLLYGYAENRNGGWLLCVDGKNHNRTQSMGTYMFCTAYTNICFTQRNLCKRNIANRDMKVTLAYKYRYVSRLALYHEPRPCQLFMIKTVTR